VVKTIIGSFDGYHAAQTTVRALINDGFMSRDISVLASNMAGVTRTEEGVKVGDPMSNAATGAVTGGLVGGAAGLAAGLMGLAIPGIGPILAAGPLLATLGGVGAGAVAGGLIGALTDAGVPEEHAGFYAESIRRGGTLVTLCADESRAERAAQIMRENGAIDLDQRVSRWREEGWTSWDPAAPPYSPEEAERERRVYGTHADPLTGLPSTSEPDRESRRDSTIRH